MKTDMLKPSVSLLVKLGSIAVHVEELLAPGGHPFDKMAINALLKDPEVEGWLAEMDVAALLPRRR